MMDGVMDVRELFVYGAFLILVGGISNMVISACVSNIVANMVSRRENRRFKADMLTEITRRLNKRSDYYKE